MKIELHLEDNECYAIAWVLYGVWVALFMEDDSDEDELNRLHENIKQLKSKMSVDTRKRFSTEIKAFFNNKDVILEKYTSRLRDMNDDMMGTD